MGIYSNLCGSCIHLDPNDRKSSEFKYYCDKYHAYYTLTDSCRYYEEAKGRNHDELYKKTILQVVILQQFYVIF